MKAISCIYNLRCDSPFSSHKKAKSSLIPTFPYLHIFVFLYFRISIHSRSAKLRRNPDAGFSDILVSGCSRTRRMIWPDIAQNPTTPKTSKKTSNVRPEHTACTRTVRTRIWKRRRPGFSAASPPHFPLVQLPHLCYNTTQTVYNFKRIKRCYV